MLEAAGFQVRTANDGEDALGILLSGMGRDGVAGLAEMRQARALTPAQDEESSVVFGMPGEAFRRGAAVSPLAPEDMARLLLRWGSTAP